eukprot:CAMPEP_0168461770 /NCGR_PEP_ID=MMETSP0228-20121227/54158_1 /TAXON_ID=133427 /ORGANISM="Protoceratium reticulatum, Strain CCCM 535 (=CCMP 1889)" /LENGTH=79 /DNA_ID=CAMNT_0008477099 /DNA_START=52 /DNA_END=287 /DNA_ORIENTATION=-
MWLFGGAAQPEADESQAEAREAEALRAEAEELRLRFEALQAADYREQLRAGCAATAAAGGACGSSAAPCAEHFRMDDGS